MLSSIRLHRPLLNEAAARLITTLALVAVGCGSGASGSDASAQDDADGNGARADAAGDVDGNGAAASAGSDAAGPGGSAGHIADDGSVTDGAGGTGPDGGAGSGGLATCGDGSVSETGGEVNGGAFESTDGSTDGVAPRATDWSVVCTKGPGGLAVVPTIVDDGTTVDTTAFSGGPIQSGAYDLVAVTHYGSAYHGATVETLFIDAIAKTMVDVSDGGGMATKWGYNLASPCAAVLSGTPVLACQGTPEQSWSYTFLGRGAGSHLTMNVVGSQDVKVFVKGFGLYPD